MKKTLLITLLPLLMVSCGLIPGGGLNSAGDSSRSVMATGQPISTPTPYFIPTSTVGWQGTAIAAQSTSDAALRLMVESTAAQDRRNHEEKSWTVTADAKIYQQLMWTATAVYTAIPMTQTAVEIAKTTAADDRIELAATINAPTNIVAIANAKVQAQLAEPTAKVNLFVKFAIGIFILCLGFLLIWLVFRPARIQEEPLDIPNLSPLTPYAPQDGNQDKLIRAVVPAPLDILLEFADGFVNRGMTTGFNAWEGTDVHKYLKDLREFFIDNKFFKLVRGSGGVLDPQVTGEQFLRDTWENKEPPHPYVCIV